MKRIFFTIIALLAINNIVFSQDIITKKSGEDIQTKVLEISHSEVKYKLYSNQEGPTYTLLKSDILMVRYENGTKDIFDEVKESNPISTSPSPSSAEDMRMKGQIDSKLNYKGRRSGAGWTSAITILTSPVLGVIPAAVFSSIEPSEKNLNFPDAELMKNYDYNQAYVKEAHKAKKKKVWISYAGSSATWLLLLFLL